MGARGEAEGLTYVPYPYCIVLLCSLITWVCLVLLYGDRAVKSYCSKGERRLLGHAKQRATVYTANILIKDEKG
jgi:hypothetical protein